MSLIYQENDITVVLNIRGYIYYSSQKETLTLMAVWLQGQTSFSSPNRLKVYEHVHGPLQKLYRENLLRGYTLLCCFI